MPTGKEASKNPSIALVNRLRHIMEILITVYYIVACLVVLVSNGRLFRRFGKEVPKSQQKDFDEVVVEMKKISSGSISSSSN